MTQIHHYIPRLILKRFSDDGKRIRVFDKAARTTSRLNFGDFGIRGFNDLPEECIYERVNANTGLVEGTFNLEQVLSSYESDAAPLISRILSAAHFTLNNQERGVLMRYVAMQWARTPGYFQKAFRDLREHGLGDHEPSKLMKPLGTLSSPEDELRTLKLGSLPFIIERLGVSLFRADLNIYLAKEGELIMGDDPVVVVISDVPANLIVTMPIGVPGSRTFLPLSPGAALCLQIPFDEQVDRIGRIEERHIPLHPEGIKNFNRMQFKQALKYVVSKTLDVAQINLHDADT